MQSGDMLGQSLGIRPMIVGTIAQNPAPSASGPPQRPSMGAPERLHGRQAISRTIPDTTIGTRIVRMSSLGPTRAYLLHSSPTNSVTSSPTGPTMPLMPQSVRLILKLV